MNKKRMIAYAKIMRQLHGEIGGLENDTFSLLDSNDLLDNVCQIVEMLEKYGDE